MPVKNIIRTGIRTAICIDPKLIVPRTIVFMSPIVLFSKQRYQQGLHLRDFLDMAKEALNLLRLYILRHAKSSWSLPGMPDFDRGLNSRGTSDIINIARCMYEREYLPDQIYASPSNRTRTTIEEIKRNIRRFELSNGHRSGPNTELPIEYVEGLYSGSLGSYLNVLKSHENNNSSLMLVGHNPTCHALADSLIFDGAAETLALIAYKYPTGALAVIDVDAGKWADIRDNSGYLRDFVLPRELQAI